MRTIYHNWFLDRLCEAFGDAPVEALVQAYGGRSATIPADPSQRWIDMLGEAAAKWLCAEYGNQSFGVPTRASPKRTLQMDVTGDTIDLLFKGFNAKFNAFHQQVKTGWMDVAMKTSSEGSEEVYGWLSGLPQIREWLGSRVVSQMRTSGYVLKNKLFESTIRVPRTDIEDDKLGLV